MIRPPCATRTPRMTREDRSQPTHRWSSRCRRGNWTGYSSNPKHGSAQPPLDCRHEDPKLRLLGVADDRTPDRANRQHRPRSRIKHAVRERRIAAPRPAVSKCPTTFAAKCSKGASSAAAAAVLRNHRRRSAPSRSSCGCGARIVSALLLIAQIVHQNREWLRTPRTLRRRACEPCIGALGAPLPAPANLSAYQLRQWGVTGDPDANGTLRVRASILNTAAQLQPYPLLRVTLADRFGRSIGTRDFEPAEYLGKPTARLLAPGERVDATMEILDPGKNAEGFEIDVCLRGADQKIRLPSDVAPQASRTRNDDRQDRPLHVAVQRPARTHGRRDRSSLSHSVPAIRRGTCCIGNAQRRRALMGHAEIAPAHGPHAASPAPAWCRSPASIRR